MGEWIQKSIWRIQALFGSEDAKIHLESLNSVNAQGTAEDRFIYHAVEDQAQFSHGALIDSLEKYFKDVGDRFKIKNPFKPFMDSLNNIFRGVGGTVKNLPVYIFIILIALGLYFVFLARKGKTVI